jgi:hypothetical protein
MNTQTSDVDPQWEESSTTFPHPEHTDDDEQVEKSQPNIRQHNQSKEKV